MKVNTPEMLLYHDKMCGAMQDMRRDQMLLKRRMRRTFQIITGYEELMLSDDDLLYKIEYEERERRQKFEERQLKKEMTPEHQNGTAARA